LTEEEFARGILFMVRGLACTLSNRLRNLIPSDDLTQAGMMGALAHFRRAGNTDPQLINTVARREMYDLVRRETQRGKGIRPAAEIDEKRDEGQPSPEAEYMRAIDTEKAIAAMNPVELALYRAMEKGETQVRIAGAMGRHASRVAQIKQAMIVRLSRKFAPARPI
jgi:DNA-directed RNA polymerase specialized sigma24 family protein